MVSTSDDHDASQDEKNEKAVPMRPRFSIPAADTSTSRWWLLQDDPGTSVRMLIRDEIERNGYTDYVNRPVEQKPRPGRPPKTASRSTESRVDDIDDIGDLPESESEAEDEITGLDAQITANRQSAPSPSSSSSSSAKNQTSEAEAVDTEDTDGDSTVDAPSNSDIGALLSNRD